VARLRRCIGLAGVNRPGGDAFLAVYPDVGSGDDHADSVSCRFLMRLSASGPISVRNAVCQYI